VLYGFSHRLFPEQTAFVVVAIVFVIDGMLFVVGMARSLYAKSISTTQAELTATISTGISVNHFFSIIIALLGGLLWERLGIELLFMSAAVFGLGALIFSVFLPKPILEKTR
jgi:predicted MFS family arabinose efflux permease